MYKTVTGFFIALTINIFAVLVFAAESPINLNHSLTGHNKVAGQNKVAGHNKIRESTETTLDYTLHVENPGDTPLGNISLSLVPRPPLVPKKNIVRISYLGPRQSADFNLKVVTRMVADPDKFAQNPLSWAGTCINAEGKLIEFPVKSRSGGAK